MYKTVTLLKPWRVMLSTFHSVTNALKGSLFFIEDHIVHLVFFINSKLRTLTYLSWIGKKGYEIMWKGMTTVWGKKKRKITTTIRQTKSFITFAYYWDARWKINNIKKKFEATGVTYLDRISLSQEKGGLVRSWEVGGIWKDCEAVIFRV